MTLLPATNRQVPDQSILDHFNKQAYLGNQYSISQNFTVGTAETPLMLLNNVQTGNPQVLKSLFQNLLVLRENTASKTCMLNVYLNPTVAADAVQTVAPIADTGVLQSQTVTTTADTAGSLNSTFFTLSSINTTTKAQKNFYMWFNINGAGVDPAVSGKTGIQIAAATGASANTIATAMRTALNALTGDFTATGATSAVIIHSVAPGAVTAAADGTAATGFSFGSATSGVASNLNNTYFNLTDVSGNKYYVWMNVSSIGTDPAVSGRTAVPIAFVAGSTAAAIGTLIATAVTALNSGNSFSASGTTTVTITDLVVGPIIPMTDAGSTGFTFTVSGSQGTPVTPINLRSAYGANNIAQVNINPVPSANGTLVDSFSAAALSSGLSNLLKILDNGQSLLVTSVASASSTSINVIMQWYEL